MTFSESQALDQLRELNEQYWSGTLFPNGLVDSLRALGIEPEEHVLVSLIPDSGETWVVRVMARDHTIREIDFDLDNPGGSTVIPIGTEDYRRRRGQIVLKACKKLLEQR